MAELHVTATDLRVHLKDYANLLATEGGAGYAETEDASDEATLEWREKARFALAARAYFAACAQKRATGPPS